MPTSDKILILTADYATYRKCALAYVQFYYPGIQFSDISIIALGKKNALAWNTAKCNVLGCLDNFRDLLLAFKRIRDVRFKVVFLPYINMPKIWAASLLLASLLLLRSERELVIVNRWNKKYSMKIKGAKLPVALFFILFHKLTRYFIRKAFYACLKLRNYLVELFMRGANLWRLRYACINDGICVAYRTTAGLGDFIITLPVLQNLRANFPQTRITAIIPDNYKDLVKCIPFVSNWVFFNKKKWLHNIFKVFPDVLRFKFQAVYLLGGKKSELPAFDKFIKGRKVFNIAEPACAGGFKEPERSLPVKTGDTYIDFLLRCNIPVSVNLPGLMVNDLSREKIKSILNHQGIDSNSLIVVVTPGTVQHKRWAVARFAEIGDYLVDTYQAKVIIAEPLNSYNTDVDYAMSGLMKKKHWNLAGLLTVDLYAALLEKAKLLIVNDSGASEIAVALRTNCVVIYGSTSPGLPGHSIPSHASVVPNIACSPCNAEYCLFDKRLCFDSITVGRIAEKADVFLSGEKKDETNKSRSKD
ncbi:MAG: glycosyltransferase family 9 protein [Candidatus Omnitrophica bacterium]|nr:glycosyltransferase family 9 protein [Candidatus Omnitrophota bacterium]